MIVIVERDNMGNTITNGGKFIRWILGTNLGNAIGECYGWRLTSKLSHMSTLHHCRPLMTDYVNGMGLPF